MVVLSGQALRRVGNAEQRDPEGRREGRAKRSARTFAESEAADVSEWIWLETA